MSPDAASPSRPRDANTLVLAPAFAATGDAACAELLGGADPGETAVLFVSLTGSPDARLAHWREHVSATPPADVGVVTAGGTRSAAATAGSNGSAGGPSGGPGYVRSVSSPGDLTGLGIAVSEYLSQWEGSDDRIVVCFESLTTLLQYVDTRRVFQFLHVLTRRIEAAGAVAHYHMDPTAHDERDVRTLSSLFDEIVELDEDEGAEAEAVETDGGTTGAGSSAGGRT